MSKRLIMGNEAIAWGAMKAGVRLVAGYPGTPSSEVLETIAKNNDGSIHVEWSANEKAAMEVAGAAAYAGARVLVTMKQMGLNVAADPLMCLNYVGVKGGMVVLAADDPGPISSQTEQDTRHFAQFAKMMVFDPSSPAEAYEMVQDAFEYSEKYGKPVFLRPTTRICHGYQTVEIDGEINTKEAKGFVKDPKWVIFPKLSYNNHIALEIMLVEMSEDLDGYRFNQVSASGPKGVICSGVGYEYVKEVLGDRENVRIFKVATANPFPEGLALEFLEGVEEVLAVEELDPVLEREITYIAGKHQIPVKVYGKLTGTVANAGELSADLIKESLGEFLGESPLSPGLQPGQLSRRESREICAKAELASPPGGGVTEGDGEGAPELPASISNLPAPNSQLPPPELPARPPVLCPGCPHRGAFYAVKVAMKGKKTRYCGDIGCYTLGNAAPLDMVDTCLCMGAGLTMAQGFAHVEEDVYSFGFIGDSTFFASGLHGVANAVYNNANITIVILDNSTTAMTGHQPHPGTGRTVMKDFTTAIDPEMVLKGLGVKTVVTADPLDLKASVETVKQVAEEKGVKAILFKSPCIAITKPSLRERIDEENCINCRACIKELGCPAIVLREGRPYIEPGLCFGCGLCEAVCPVSAIGRPGGETHE